MPESKNAWRFSVAAVLQVVLPLKRKVLFLCSQPLQLLFWSRDKGQHVKMNRCCSVHRQSRPVLRSKQHQLLHKIISSSRTTGCSPLFEADTLLIERDLSLCQSSFPVSEVNCYHRNTDKIKGVVYTLRSHTIGVTGTSFLGRLKFPGRIQQLWEAPVSSTQTAAVWYHLHVI